MASIKQAEKDIKTATTFVELAEAVADLTQEQRNKLTHSIYEQGEKIVAQGGK